jgi:uncharacterized protein YndB with AHSA1/START domain
MADILHRIGVRGADATQVYAALTTLDGLAGWWTTETTGEGSPGGKIEFRFSGRGGADMEVIEADPPSRVVWRVVGGPDEWVGTTIDWTIRQEEEWTIVLFRHAGWREPGEFMHHCSTRWGQFLMSLRSLVETGSGAPAPRDVRTDNW